MPCLPVAGFAVVESSGTAYLEKKAWDFTNETAKQIMANRGNLKKIDWNDVMVNTVTSEMGLVTRLAAKTWNSAVDVNYADGSVTLFNRRKSTTNFVIDATFNYFKLGAREFSEKNQDRDAVNATEAWIDQLKKEIKDKIDKKK